MTLDQIQDKFALKHLVDHFSNLADHKNVKDQLPLFTEDAKVNTYIGGELVFSMSGHDQIFQVFTDYLAQFDIVYHLNGQQTVEIEGENAKGITYCQVTLIKKAEKDEITTHYVRYQDQYRKTNGVWQIADRLAEFMYTEVR